MISPEVILKKNLFKVPALFLFWGLIVALISFQAIIYFKYNLEWVDTDQFFMWAGLTDYANGKFYEPRYYGQDYNTFLEPLVAVPFYKMGLPVYQALPLATNIIFIFPILSSVIILHANKKTWQAIVFLSFILCMNPAYFLLNAQPRGFVTGLFFCSFYLLSVLNPSNLKFTILNSFFGLLAYFVNPNSMLLTVPLLAFLFYNNLRNRSYYISSASVLACYWPLNYFFNSFYSHHPNYIQTGLIVDFKLKYLIENLSLLDLRFAHITPFADKKSIWLFVAFCLVTMPLIKQKRRDMLFALGTFCVFMLCSFCLGKTLDGVSWVYLSYSRMYLGIPLLFVFPLALIDIKNIYPSIIIAIIALGSIFLKTQNMESKLEWHFRNKNWVALSLFRLDQALDGIQFYGEKCKQQKVKLFVVSHGFWMNNVLAYGGPAIDKDFPETIETKLDKRYWVREKFLDHVTPTFMMISSTLDISEKMANDHRFILSNPDGYGLVLVKQNKMKLKDFIALARTFEYAY